MMLRHWIQTGTTHIEDIDRGSLLEYIDEELLDDNTYHTDAWEAVRGRPFFNEDSIHYMTLQQQSLILILLEPEIQIEILEEAIDMAIQEAREDNISVATFKRHVRAAEHYEKCANETKTKRLGADEFIEVLKDVQNWERPVSMNAPSPAVSTLVLKQAPTVGV